MICAGPLKVTRFSIRVIRGHAMVFRLWAGQFRNFLPGDSVADPDPGSGAFFTPGPRDSGWIKYQDPDLGFRELRNNFLGLKYLKSGSGIRKLFDIEPGIWDGKIRIRDPGQTSRIRNTDG
jgi:hypothetical protein